MNEIIHLLLASIFIIFLFVVIFDWLQKRKSRYVANALITLAEIDGKISWYELKAKTGCPVSDIKVRELRQEREFVLSIINEENR